MTGATPLSVGMHSQPPPETFPSHVLGYPAKYGSSAIKWCEHAV